MHLKNIILTFLCTLLILNLWSQGESNIWYFGQRAGIDFNGEEPVALLDGAMNQPEGCSVMSDANGNLLFYSNGEAVWNQFHDTMPNGRDLMGSFSASQSVIIVPMPRDDEKYYVFTVDSKNHGLENGLRYSIVDMTLDNGKGDIDADHKNILLFEKVTEKLTAAKHSNDEDIWIIVHEWGSNRFLSFHVTENGVLSTPVFSPTKTSIENDLSYAIGNIKVSPFHDYLASTTPNKDLAELFYFDPTTGRITDFVTLPEMDDVSGVEFSPDNSKLYVSVDSTFTVNNKKFDLVQFDLSSGDSATIANSTFHVARSNVDINDLQLAPDGKIYAARNFQKYLGRINAPDELGDACDWVDNGFDLNERFCQLGLPDFILVIRGFITPNTCHGDTNNFRLFGIFGDYASRWVFGDGDTVYQKNPSHLYENPGTYYVEVEVTIEDSVFTFEKEIEVFALPDVDLGPDTAICAGSVVELKTSEPYISYIWQDNSNSSSYITGSAGQYSVEATDIHSCVNSDTIEVVVNPLPEVYIGEDASLCEGETITLEAVGEFDEITWWNGLNDRVIETGETGTLYVDVTDLNGCLGDDSIFIEQLFLPVVDLGNDTSLCDGITFQLYAGNGDYVYEWWDGSTENYNYVSDSGEYWISATNKCGTVNSTIYIFTRDCDPDIYFPNAFTPNGDGINDIFLPIPLSVDIYESKLLIFSRFGQVIYDVDDMNIGWDGTSKGNMCDVGSYVWMISYRHYQDGINLSTTTRIGNITLLR